jgi:hypothetical protein
MLEEITTIDKIEILGTWNIQVRQKNAIMRDGVEISATFHRWVLVPGTTLPFAHAQVEAVCAAVWTPEVVAAYEAFRTQE